MQIQCPLAAIVTESQQTPEMTFAEQLKSQRQRLGLTQSEAADLLEVSASWVDKAEREIRTPIKITQEGALARLTKAEKHLKE